MKALTKIITITVLGLAALLLLTMFVLRPVMAEVKIANATVKAQKSEVILLDQQILAFKTAQSDLARASRKDEIAAAIQPRENLVLAVSDLETAAGKTGTTENLDLGQLGATKDKTPDIIAGKQGIDEIPYVVTTLNDFTSTVNFLSYLEHLPHFTEISKISLSAETTTNSQKEQIHTGKVIGVFNGVFFVKSPQ